MNPYDESLLTSMLFVWWRLTQLGDLSVEWAAHCPAMQRQPCQAIMADGVPAKQQPRDLIPLERENVFTDSTL